MIVDNALIFVFGSFSGFLPTWETAKTFSLCRFTPYLVILLGAF